MRTARSSYETHRSPQYYHIIEGISGYIKMLATTEREGYKKPHGFSGANAGIPLNIIALADGEVMLNPKILDHHLDTLGTVITESNCGSLMLDRPISIRRYAGITFEFYDVYGKRHIKSGFYPTVQHEIDHNNGILITDRKV